MMSSVVMTENSIRVEPGESATLTLIIRNSSQVVDDFTVEVAGEVGEWTTAEPASIPLFPNEEGQVTLHFSPPRNSHVVAGERPFAARVVSREDASAVFVE